MKRAGKGFGGTFKRLSVLPGRYGISSAKMRARLHNMIEALQRIEITPTIPITAQTLKRHPELRSELDGVDPAIHGYRHVAYSSLTPPNQARDLDLAQRVFMSHGLLAHGFRAPYLRADEATLRILRARKFSYDSSAPSFVALDEPIGGDAYRLAALRYGELRNGPILPDYNDGLVELPVSLPDDEILVDGLGLENTETIGRVLRKMVEAACSHGSLLVLQIHPERFPFFADAMTSIGRLASDLDAWRASLSEIAERCGRNSFRNGHRFVLSVTGDIDAATLGDFGPRLWGK